MTSRFVLSVCLGLVLGGAAGADPLGRVTAYVDGVETTWHTVTFTRGTQVVATASLSHGPRLTEIEVHGHPEPVFSGGTKLSVMVRYLGIAEPGDDPMGIEVIYMPQGMRGPLWTSRGAPESPSFDLVSLGVWGNFARIEAVFSGQLCLRPRLFSATDTSDCKTISGLIETELQVE